MSIFEQFQNIVNPSTTLGAFLISIAASIVASVLIGFFTGRHYQKKIDKKNSIEANTAMGSITQDKIKNNSESGSSKKSRFIMSLEEAVDLVLYAFEHGENGDLFIMKAPACSIGLQAEAVCEMFGGKKEDIKVIGIRHGGKMYETLLTNEEYAKAIDLGGFYCVPADNRGLNYDKYFKDEDAKRNTLTEFNSNNTRLLNKEKKIKTKMMELTYIQERLVEEE